MEEYKICEAYKECRLNKKCRFAIPILFVKSFFNKLNRPADWVWLNSGRIPCLRDIKNFNGTTKKVILITKLQWLIYKNGEKT